MKVTGSSEVMAPNYQNAQHHMTEDCTPVLALNCLVLCHSIGHVRTNSIMTANEVERKQTSSSQNDLGTSVAELYKTMKSLTHISGC